MLGLAVGAKTRKMHQGHHGANHPVKDETTGKVEITSMNHGFAVDQATLPKGATQTHISLFDGSNCGIQLDGKPVFSVQYHPEASPGPRDSHYLFKRFADLMRANKRSLGECPGSKIRHCRGGNPSVLEGVWMPGAVSGQDRVALQNTLALSLSI